MLVNGVFWGPWFALHRSLSIFNASEFLKIVKTLAANMGKTMAVMMPLCILVTLGSVFVYPEKDTIGFYLCILSLIFILGSLIITMAVELPIVNEIRQCTVETLPANWEAKRDRWVKFHGYRIIAGMLSFAFFAFSILFLV